MCVCVCVCVKAARVSASTGGEWKSFCCINSLGANDGFVWLLQCFYSSVKQIRIHCAYVLCRTE